MPTSQGNLTARDAGALALKAGFTVDEAITLVSIGYAESGLNPNKVNVIPPDLSYGWLQINMRGALGPERRKKYALANNEALLNPATNVAVARRIFLEAHGKFTDWTTYNNGKWLAYQGIGQFGVKEAQGTGIDKTIDALNKNLKLPGWDISIKDLLKASSIGGAIVVDKVDPAKSVADAVSGIAGFVTNRENWLRVAAVGGGAILIILAVGLLVSDTIVGQIARKAVKATDTKRATPRTVNKPAPTPGGAANVRRIAPKASAS